MTPEQQIANQERTIKSQWFEISRLKKRIGYLTSEVERLTDRKPTEEETQEAIFGGQE